MISFGELRKKSLEWKVELSDVERIYALDWLVRGIFLRPALESRLALNGETALALAYFVQAPRVRDVDLIRASSPEGATLEQELTAAAEESATASGLSYRLTSFQETEARFEFTGPLGRRSAAQPLIVVRVVPRVPRIEPSVMPLVHPFSEPLEARVRAVAPEELAAEGIVGYGQRPRAREVYNLWLLLTLGMPQLDAELTQKLAAQIADARHVALADALAPAYAPLLERAWDKSLAKIAGHPSFAQAQADIHSALKQLELAA